MTKNELKALIKECIEESMEERENLEAVDEEVEVVPESVLEETQMIMEALQDGACVIVNEKVSWKFMPTLKKERKTSKLYDACKDAEGALNAEGEPTKAGIQKLASVALRILDILQNITDFFTLPACLLIITIPFYCLQRCISWAIRIGEEAVTKSYAQECIASYRKLLAKAETDAQKAKIQAQIDKLEKLIESLDKED